MCAGLFSATSGCGHNTRKDAPACLDRVNDGCTGTRAIRRKASCLANEVRSRSKRYNLRLVSCMSLSGGCCTLRYRHDHHNCNNFAMRAANMKKRVMRCNAKTCLNCKTTARDRRDHHAWMYGGWPPGAARRPLRGSWSISRPGRALNYYRLGHIHGLIRRAAAHGGRFIRGENAPNHPA